VDLDGYPDIAARQHGGAKWGYLHWFLYDPKTRRVCTDALTRRLSDMTYADFRADPQTERITITRFFGVDRKEYTFRVVDGQLLFCGSKWDLAGTQEQSQRESLTPPDRWQEPRIYHSPITDVGYDDKVRFSRCSSVDVEEKILSANGGYWFALETRADEDLEADTSLWVFNERGYLIRIDILGTDRRYRGRADWINEKRIHFQRWWGRALSGYLLLDVESEQTLQKEFVHDGPAAFEQLHEARRNGLDHLLEAHAHQDGQEEEKSPSK